MSCANEAAFQTYMHWHELYTHNACRFCSVLFCALHVLVHRNCRFPVQLMKTVSLLYSFLEFMSKTQITHDTNSTSKRIDWLKWKLKVIAYI